MWRKGIWTIGQKEHLYKAEDLSCWVVNIICFLYERSDQMNIKFDKDPFIWFRKA